MTVLVTVVGPRGSADLELDDACPVGDLLDSIAVVLSESPGMLPSSLATSDGAQLSPEASLAEAGVVDGNHLMLVPSHETAPAASVLACYLVVDTSDSMAGPGLEALNVEVARLLEALRNDARLRDACQVAVITFDAEARLHLPLTPGDQLDQAPRFAATRPATNFEAAFRFLRQQIVQDVEQLRSRNMRPRRPAVFLLTDGRPTRGYWPSAHAELTDQSWSDAPDVIVFGFGEAAGPAIRRIGTAGAYLPASAAGVAQGGPAGMLSVLTTFVRDAIHSPLGRPPSDPPRRSAPDAGDALPPTSQRARPGWRSLDEVRR